MNPRSKWDVSTPTKIEGKPAKFNTSCHVILPCAWRDEVVVTVTKKTWDESQTQAQQK
jgi:hypothetical protein